MVDDELDAAGFERGKRGEQARNPICGAFNMASLAMNLPSVKGSVEHFARVGRVVRAITSHVRWNLPEMVGADAIGGGDVIGRCVRQFRRVRERSAVSLVEIVENRQRGVIPKARPPSMANALAGSPPRH